MIVNILQNHLTRRKENAILDVKHMNRLIASLRRWNLVILAAAVWLLALPREAYMSGMVEQVSLEKALMRRPFVFVVERAVPFERTVKLLRQPRPPDTPAAQDIAAQHIAYHSFKIKEILSRQTSYSLFTKDEIEATPDPAIAWSVPADDSGLFKLAFPDSAGRKIWVINSQSALNIELERRAIEEGVHKIPIYYELADGISNPVRKGRLYILLATQDPGFQCSGHRRQRAG